MAKAVARRLHDRGGRFARSAGGADAHHRRARGSDIRLCRSAGRLARRVDDRSHRGGDAGLPGRHLRPGTDRGVHHSRHPDRREYRPGNASAHGQLAGKRDHPGLDGDRGHLERV